jgi:hypothetical protein
LRAQEGEEVAVEVRGGVEDGGGPFIVAERW